ncbi:Cinnamyl-alcohol dehydrogenase, putative [Theobroma cacao]|uniref:Cinnamyl-alcohol dehydrogenase, putative n=1 Tax=Theobroma cacao TaxID=3641 RepID=A0A061G3M4_THECC|nr:Cinnamyl-alcohol dehydrogenase, putative [Theobroma cacao]
MLRHNMNQPGKYIEVIGLGGLGHMAVKFGKAFGLHVAVFSTSIAKKEEALNLLGADKIVVSSDQEQMMGLEKSLVFRVGTATGDHPFNPYMSLLKSFKRSQVKSNSVLQVFMQACNWFIAIKL